jgi:hypothetical protein
VVCAISSSVTQVVGIGRFIYQSIVVGGAVVSVGRFALNRGDDGGMLCPSCEGDTEAVDESSESLCIEMASSREVPFFVVIVSKV